MSNTRVEFAGIGPFACEPYARLGGMTRFAAQPVRRAAIPPKGRESHNRSSVKLTRERALIAAIVFTAASSEGQACAAFSRDGGRTFAQPIRVDDVSSPGQVDIELLADGSERRLGGVVERSRAVQSTAHRAERNALTGDHGGGLERESLSTARASWRRTVVRLGGAGGDGPATRVRTARASLAK